MNGLVWYLLGLLALGIVVNIFAWGGYRKRTKKMPGIDNFAKTR